MVLLDNLFYRVLCIYVLRELHAVIDLIEVFFDHQGRDNLLVYSLTVGFEVRGCDIPVSNKEMLKKTMACDSEEDGAIVLQLLDVCVFEGVDELIIE